MALQLRPVLHSCIKELVQVGVRSHVSTASRTCEVAHRLNGQKLVTLASVQTGVIRSDSNIHRLSLGSLHCLTNTSIQIGDFPISNISYECPKIPALDIEITPPPSLNKVKPLDDPRTNQIKRRSPGVDMPEKQASERMRIRHKKMKKHQLKRLRERTWPIIRKTRHLKHIKKMRLYNNKLETLRSYGSQFDAMDFIQSSVNKARKRGYFIDVLGSDPMSSNFKNIQKEKKEDKPDLASVLQGMTVREK